MLFRSFQTILDECLWALRQGESIESCLGRYPRQANRLRPYLNLAARVGHSPLVEPHPIAQTNAWIGLRGRAAELRTGKRRRKAVRTTSYGAWLRPVAAALAAVFALTALSSGTALAAQDAMPNSPLYRVKLATEDIHLWLVFDEEHEAEILLDQSKKRSNEIRAMSRQGNEIPGIVLEALNDRTERAAAIIAERPNAAGLRDELRAQALGQEKLLVAVQSDVDPSASRDYREAFATVHNSYLLGTGTFATALLSEDLADGVQAVSGIVSRTDAGWTVGGISVGVDGRTISGQELVEGATAELIVGVSSNGRRHALSVTRISVNPTPSDLIVSGEIEEVTSDHIIIAGQTIPITDATFLKGQAKKGKRVSVRFSSTAAGVVAETIGSNSAADDATSLTFEGVMETDLAEETEELVVSGQRFLITADTSLDFTAGNAGDGVRVRVDAMAGDDDALEAQRVTVLAVALRPRDDTYLVGTFEGARPGVWVVSGIELGSPSGNAEAPQEGSIVAVDAREADDLLDVTSFYVIQEPGQSLVRVEGTTSTIDDTVWNFGFGAVTVDSTAEVSGKPVSGARAIVWGSKDANGAIEAVYVRVLDERTVIAPADAGSGASQ